MRFEECLHKGLIKKDSHAPQRVDNSLKIAERFLKSARKNLEIEEYEMAELGAYNCIFHSGRALLFAKGYVERSHYCLSVALGYLYEGKLGKALSTFDKIRSSRHNIQYGSSLINREEAEFVVEFAGDFLNIAKETLDQT